ncbi:MAG: hypothetical protein HC869_18495 [Rhodospirillales bacterium]|nr:hypothetical protein [Rhodospirillales bacterium]
MRRDRPLSERVGGVDDQLLLVGEREVHGGRSCSVGFCRRGMTTSWPHFARTAKQGSSRKVIDDKHNGRV